MELRKELYDPRRLIEREENERKFRQATYALYWQAERARKLGISWRNFCVGCCVYAFKQDVVIFGDHWRAFYGMNTKVAENSRNVCAEPVTLGAAYGTGYEEIIGMVIVGQPQPDERGETPLTLRPCTHCRTLMKAHPLITPQTIIVTAHPPPFEFDHMDQVTHETHTFGELLALYGES
jgi:cytidine deaminase